MTSFSQPERPCARVAHSEKVAAFPPSSTRPKYFSCRSRDLPEFEFHLPYQRFADFGFPEGTVFLLGICIGSLMIWLEAN